MSKLSLAVEPLTSKRAIACPACDRTLALIDGKGVTMAVVGTYLTDDGDTIPGSPQQFEGMESAFLASVGKCPYCSNRHWLLEVNLHEGGQDALFDALADDPKWVRSWISPVKHPDDEPVWTAHECNTATGRFFQINIGPMSVPADLTTHGPNGVSSCDGGGRSRSFWEHAAENFRALQPQLQATIHQVRGEKT